MTTESTSWTPLELSPLETNQAKVMDWDSPASTEENEELLGKENNDSSSAREGTIPSSIFSLVILCLGSGTLTFPYIFYANGLFLGFGLICFGAAISIYTGWLIVNCAEQCGARRYEDIALKLFGRRMATFTSVMILLTMLGFVIAYIVLVSLICG